MKRVNRAKVISVAVGGLVCGAAQAFTFESDGGAVRGSLDSTVSFGFGVRAGSQGCDTVVGANSGTASAATGSGAPSGCIDSAAGYNDQGNLNYKQGQAFTTYLKGTHELLLKLPENYKFMARVNWVKDFAATHTSGILSGIGSTSSFSGDAKRELDHKVRLLDFWVSKDFDMGNEPARIKVGNQVISWGESLFLPGGINQTNAMDLMRLAQPGTQLKEVMLPAPIASMTTGLGNGFSVEAYTQAGWNKNYFPPLGSYWSTSMIGNGAADYGVTGYNMPTKNTPKNSGQYGVALRYQPEGTQANFGVYAMRYHDKSPSVIMDGTTAKYTYLEDRNLLGASLNFPLGNWAIGSELSYRPKESIPLNSMSTSYTCPDNKCYVETGKYQWALTGLLSLTPGDHGNILKALGGADTATLLAEAVVVSYPDLKKSYGNGTMIASGTWFWGALKDGTSSTAVGDKTSAAFNMDFSWTYDGTLIPGWQVTPEIYYFHAFKGRSPGAQGIFMEGAKSANFIVTFTQNPADWAIGINYAKFWGGDSVLDQPLRGRDFYGAYISRNF